MKKRRQDPSNNLANNFFEILVAFKFERATIASWQRLSCLASVFHNPTL
mgnify:CR=1 FL=1